MITVSLNNEAIQVVDGTLLANLLAEQPPTGAFAVAINGEFVPRSQYDATQLLDGDQVDIVSPVGGG